MANELTTTRIKAPVQVGAWFEGIYTAVCTTTKATGELVIDGDILEDFDYLYTMSVEGNDTIADNSFVAKAVLPAHGTAITTSNVLMSFHYTPAAAALTNPAALAVCNAVDLSSIGDMRIHVRGRQKAS